MWFCQDCLGPASQIIKNVSDIQKRQEVTEDELRKTGKRMDVVEEKITESKCEVDSCIQELQKQITDLNTKLHFVEDEAILHRENQKWADIVNIAVDSKLKVKHG